LRHPDSADKSYCIDNRGCKREVGHDSIQKRDKFPHKRLLPFSVYSFGSVGISGTLDDTNMELVPGGSGSHGNSRAYVVTIAAALMNARPNCPAPRKNLFVASLRRRKACRR